METCFIIQPFDKGKYDQRYEDIFEPAIKHYGLEPYRVDKDPSVNIPIEDIELGIKNARFCFAEISTNNPNVWFELGYAIACQKECILVCSDERDENFPFDVRHRNIIRYCTNSPSDFNKLSNSIKAKIKTILDKPLKIESISQSPVSNIEGLSSYEIMILAIILSNQDSPSSTVSAWQIKQDMNKNGYNDTATNLGFRKLIDKNMVEYKIEHEFNGDEYSVYSLTSVGDAWLIDNENKLNLYQE